MPPPDGQGQEDIDKTSCRYGTVVLGSANLQGAEAEYSFRFLPSMSVDGENDVVEIKGQLLAAAVNSYGRTMFASNAPVTLVFHGAYTDPKKIKSILPGMVRPQDL